MRVCTKENGFMLFYPLGNFCRLHIAHAPQPLVSHCVGFGLRIGATLKPHEILVSTSNEPDWLMCFFSPFFAR